MKNRIICWFTDVMSKVYNGNVQTKIINHLIIRITCLKIISKPLSEV